MAGAQSVPPAEGIRRFQERNLTFLTGEQSSLHGSVASSGWCLQQTVQDAFQTGTRPQRFSDTSCAVSSRPDHKAQQGMQSTYRELGQHRLLLKVVGFVCIVIIHGGGDGLGVPKAPPGVISFCCCCWLTSRSACLPAEAPRSAAPKGRLGEEQSSIALVIPAMLPRTLRVQPQCAATRDIATCLSVAVL